jgi:endonuclease/exonuclease/phosphatase family metal-dependent hydrolase
MAIPPGESRATLETAVRALNSDVYAIQEVDHFLPRSHVRAQSRDIAEAIGARYWAMGPSVMGTPGERWRKKKDSEPNIITHDSDHAELMHECYGIAIVSKVPVKQWHHLHLGNSPLGLPLLVPGDETGKGKPRFLYVKDEPRLALAAVLDNGWTVINTHLSFVPLFNLIQLKKLKRWALHLARSTDTKVVIVGDLNLPKNLPIALSSWKSLATKNTYPSWGGKIQFDYLLVPKNQNVVAAPLAFAPTGISDHLPIGVELQV